MRVDPTHVHYSWYQATHRFAAPPRWLSDVIYAFFKCNYIGQRNSVVTPEKRHKQLITEAVNVLQKLKKKAVYVSTMRIQTLWCP